MTEVKIEDKWYKADDAVVKRMGEYYEAMKFAIDRMERLVPAVVHMRKLQKGYFKTKDVSLLIKSKEAEKEVDDILAGRTKKDLAMEQELWR